MTRSHPWLTAVLQLAILLTVVALATPWLDAAVSPLPTPRRSGDVALRGIQARPIFNGSVVPGGVYSLDELRAVIERDPVVAAHYRHARLDEMQAVTLTSGRAAYVSYRIGDRVYWTRNRVWLKAGETVLTDGTTTIRARCGNCVSAVSQEAGSANEPAPDELDGFVVPQTPDAGVDAFAAETEAGLGDLLSVPFAPELFAALAPGSIVPAPGLEGDLFGDSVPGVLFPPLMPPRGGAGNGGGPTGVPPGFVPPDVPGGGGGPGGPGGGGPGGGGPGGGTVGVTTAGPTGAATTGDVTTGVSTSGPSGGDTNGEATDGSGFPTSGGVTTSTGATSTGATPAPEPEMLWLVATGLIGLASRKVRRRP